METEPMRTQIVYEDRRVLVCYKPAYLATQTSKMTEKDLVDILRDVRQRQGEPSYVGVVHRLDQPVEGLLVFAKDKAAAAALSRQVQQGRLCKEYVAVVTGFLPPAGILEDYLLRDGARGKAEVVSADVPGAKAARLSYHVAGMREGRQLVSIVLHTGRFHQIRAQLSRHEAPILGDVKYGGISTGEPLALCAYRLSFDHPDTGERRTFSVQPHGTLFAEWRDELGALMEKS